MLDASACWLGGIWSDAEGRPAAERKDDIHRRCHYVLLHVYNEGDKAREEQLRALEAETVKDLTVKVGALAANNPEEAANRDTLTRLVQLEAAAAHEALYARRAADRVKIDLDAERRQGTLIQHEVDAIPALRAHEALKALLQADVGPFSHDARAIGLIMAMGRMEIARGLPKHLKVYAVADLYQTLFGVAIPALPQDVTAPLPGGEWLSYLSSAAQAAGYPVPPAVTDLRRREMLAWDGVGMGLGDKLGAEERQLSADAIPLFRRIVESIGQQLTTQYRVAQLEAAAKSQP